MKTQLLLSLMVIALAGLSCSKKNASQTPSKQAEAGSTQPAAADPPMTPSTPPPLPEPPTAPATAPAADPSSLLILGPDFALEDLGAWGDHVMIHDLPRLSDDKTHLMQLEWREFESPFAPEGEDEGPFHELEVEKIRLLDLQVIARFPLVTKEDIHQAHRDAREKACVDKVTAPGADTQAGVADCPVDAKRSAAAVEAARATVLRRAAPLTAELKAGGYAAMLRVPPKDPPRNEDGEEAEATAFADPELVHTVKVTRHRPTVRVLRRAGGPALAEVELKCTALPETSCTLADHIQVFADAKRRLALVIGREVDLENGKVLAKITRVLPLKN